MEVDHHVDVKNNKQQKLSNVRKEKSRDAARNRRNKENLQYVELAKLLPLPEAVTSQLDKASVIRLTISFLKYCELSGTEARRKSNEQKAVLHPVNIGNKEVSLCSLEKNMGLHYLQALDGFLFCVSQEGKFLYISETVSTHLGLSQLDLVGSSVFNVLHPDDHKEFSELLCRPTQPSDTNYMHFDDFDAMNFAEMSRKSKQGYISLFLRMKCALVKRGACYMKSSGYKVIHISGQLVPFKKVDQNGERSYALVATGQPLPQPTICQLKLDTKCFVSRVGMDLRIAFCEGKIRKYMNFTARDIVGMSAYEFYHLNDMMIVQDAHTDCINGGKCVSRAYRWMNKTGGWVWMQTVGTVIKRSTPHGEESQILCVNYISSDVEEGNEVMHSIQQHFSASDLKEKSSAAEKDSLDDFGIDSKQYATPSADDISASYANDPNVYDKDSYLLSLEYDSQVNLHNQMMSNSTNTGTNMLDNILGPQGLAIPSVHDRIPSWQESQAMDDANDLATHMLLVEMEADKTPVKFPFEDKPSSPESGLADFSPVPNSIPPLHNGPFESHVFAMKSTSVMQSFSMNDTRQEGFNPYISHQSNTVHENNTPVFNPHVPMNNNACDVTMVSTHSRQPLHVNTNFRGVKTEPMIEDPFVSVTRNCFNMSQPKVSPHSMFNEDVSNHPVQTFHTQTPSDAFSLPNIHQHHQFLPSVSGSYNLHQQPQKHVMENIPVFTNYDNAMNYEAAHPVQNTCYDSTSYGNRLLQQQQHLFTPSSLPYL